LIGRHVEREAIDTLLAGARAGSSGALVVRGEAGIGKTALLQHATGVAAQSGFLVQSSSGSESESQFAFAGLHQLCGPLLEQGAALPDPQRLALAVAFGEQRGDSPDRFLVGLATLNLLAEAAEASPTLCVVDDVQWLDEASAQVFAFVARRISAERIAFVFALREHAPGEPAPAAVAALGGMPEVHLRGLSDQDARSLLDSELVTRLDHRVLERVVAEAHGNPMALLELPLSAQSAHLAGGFELPAVIDVPRRVEESFRHRSAELPTNTRLLILLAAAEPTGDAELFWRAASHAGIGADAVDPAEGAGLLEVGSSVRFRHPLVRSAVYRDATPPDRRRAHAVLAAVTDATTDPDRRAWHRAQAVLGTDEDAAADLERSAGRARSRGGLAASAAFMEHAARLTPDPAMRATRALDAAFAAHEAGASEAASELLALAQAGPLDAHQNARVDLLRARIAFENARAGEGLEKLLSAARGLAEPNPVLSRETYLEALDAAIVTGGVGTGLHLRDVAEAAHAAPRTGGRQAPTDLLLDGLVTTFTEGYGVGAPVLRRALETFVAESGADPAGSASIRRWGWLASRTAMAVFDDELVHTLTDRHVSSARAAGDLATLPSALLVKSVMSVLGGEFLEAAGHAEVAAATRTVPLLHAQLILAAWRGQAERTQEIRSVMVRESAGRGGSTEIALTQYAMAVLHNGLGEYAAARVAATAAFESIELTQSNLAHSELVEAACRSGEPQHAVHALDELIARARASGTGWGLGLAAVSQALMTDGPEAERHYRESIEQLGRSRTGALLARSRLLYGEWLRREGRRQDAREQLRTAHEQFSRMGADAFAERAARELRATGEHPRARVSQATDALTPHELHIARMVAGGATSREIGVQLFLSPRTIEAHLRNIFQKLGITSRRQLRDLSLT
jgi:DNA-binding CsgD family transcriptional regulator